MADRWVKRRAVFVAALLAAAFLFVHEMSHGERRSPRRSLDELPPILHDWTGTDSPLDPRVLELLRVDDYLSRVYRDGRGHLVGLYIGFYGSQRTGDTIHSPKNCLPGSGWEPVHSRLLTIDLPGQKPVQVNEYLIEKGLDRQLVLYWYHGRGRVVASEYWGKVWLVADAITRNRTDGALIRVVTSAADGEAQARAREVEFVTELYPRLNEFIPD